MLNTAGHRFLETIGLRLKSSVFRHRQRLNVDLKPFCLIKCLLNNDPTCGLRPEPLKLRPYGAIETSCAGGRHNMPPPLQVHLKSIDLESGVRVRCDVGYLCANFGLPIGLSVLDLGPMYATDRRQTKASLNVPAYYGRGHNNANCRNAVTAKP